MVEISELPSSSSPTHDGHRYDVFLSFRGLDTRLNFTAHLHKELVNANISTFLDDEEIETGEDLKPELESAIKASRASIIVLSENYASSTWCLDELVLILDRRRYSSDHIVIPIFYHVEPTDVRKQESSFGIAMEKHKRKMGTETDAEKKGKWAEKMELWNKALKEVADLKGKTANGRNEVEFIEEIVADIHRRLRVPLSVTLPHLIGMNDQIKFIASWLKDGSSGTADILTILGMGGIGKTSLAKYVFGLHCREFQRYSFIEDISRSVTKFNGLLELQKQICGDISKTSSNQIHLGSVYTSKIENALSCQKVFIVLDDIDSLDHLHALLGKKGFHPGSKIIITTKDVSLMERYTLFHPAKNTELLLEGLYKTSSLELLCHHAFNCNSPKEGYEEVSKMLVKYCDGHPLALEVLGASLCNRDVAEWEDYIKSLKKETDSRVTEVLQRSFDSLSNNDKQLFKHIACFFVGKDRESTETILQACGIHTVVGIKNLSNRCLLKIGNYNKLIWMHQMIQEMGRNVVRQESINKPWKRSRLWYHEESFTVLKQKKGKGNLLGLALDMRMLEKDKLHYELKTDALSKMDNLMLLQLNYVQLNGSFKKFPEELRWLCMHGFPLDYIPLDLPMENLVSLDMSYSNLESFDVSYSNLPQPEKRQKLMGSCSKDKRLLRSLKILNLSFSEQLRSIGGFSELPALKRLILSNCIGLIEVCESIEQCNDLVVIDLSYCIEVRKLPRTMAKLKRVETLILDGCNFGELPIETRDMDSPEMLNANSIGKSSHTSSLANVKAIPRDLQFVRFSLPRSLVSLSLAKCGLSNESFPIDFNGLSMLKTLNLDGNPILSLPNCVRSLCKLEALSMSQCSHLKTVMHPPRTLTNLLLDGSDSIEEIVFHPEMSPLKYFRVPEPSEDLFRLVEGMVKVEAMTHVAKEVLESLGWGTNLDFIEEQQTEAKNWLGRTHKFEVQMRYEFGIFSTYYQGKEIPNWISDRRKGSSISFTMPSSPNKLRGFNICYAVSEPTDWYEIPDIRISNVTKDCSWTYHWSGSRAFVVVRNMIFLSHWMFGKNEMEDGDQVTIDTGYFDNWRLERPVLIKECGISVVYEDEDGKMEEDPLAYYKSWNYIIGGDLSPFQNHGTGGEYVLDSYCLGWPSMSFPLRHVTSLNSLPVPRSRGSYYRAFSQRKADIVDVAAEVIFDTQVPS